MQSEKVPYYILDLLQQVPSVYVPGLGRFEAIFHPAVIDIPTSRINPPFIEPAFDASAEVSEDLLPKYMRYASGMDIAEAKSLVDDFVAEVLELLEKGENYSIESFGTFSRSEADVIHFTPDWDAFNLSFRGLESLDLAPPVVYNTPPVYTPPVFQEMNIPPVEPLQPVSNWVTDRETEVPVIPPAPDVIKPVTPVISDNTSRLWWMILAIALFLITVLCAYLAWDILSNRKQLDPATFAEQDTLNTGTMDDVVTIPDTTITAIDIPYKDSIVVETPEPVTTPEPEKPSKPAITGDACYVVVGAFSNADNIARMVERITSMGYEAEKLTGGTLTKVAIRTSCDQATLQKTLTEARSSINPEAWVR